MRKNQSNLVAIRSMESYGTRHLSTRGPLPAHWNKGTVVPQKEHPHMDNLDSFYYLNTLGSKPVEPEELVEDTAELEYLERLAPRQSMRSSIAHYSYPRVTKITVGKRWLRQQVGQQWDDVYAQLREACKTKGNLVDLALERLRDQVAVNVFKAEDGRWQVRTEWSTYPVDGFFVNPENGKLDFVNLVEFYAAKRKQKKRALAVQKAQSRATVSKTLQLHKIDGLWFWVELAPITAARYITTPDFVCRDGSRIKGHTRVVPESVCRDVLTKREFFTVPSKTWETHELFEQYGSRDMYAARKWQASREDVKRYVVQEALAA